jgi:hypothetical protein
MEKIKAVAIRHRNALTVAAGTGTLVLAGSAPAFAQETPSAQTATVGTSLQQAVTDAKDVIGDNMPLVFTVAIAFVAWRVGKRVLGKI